MGWDFKVDCIAERIAKGKVAAEKVKAIVSAPMMTMTELKAMIPIKWVLRADLKTSHSQLTINASALFIMARGRLPL